MEEESQIVVNTRRVEDFPIFDIAEEDRSSESSANSNETIEADEDMEQNSPIQENVLVVETDPYCTRCKGLLDEITL